MTQYGGSLGILLGVLVLFLVVRAVIDVMRRGFRWGTGGELTQYERVSSAYELAHANGGPWWHYLSKDGKRQLNADIRLYGRADADTRKELESVYGGPPSRRKPDNLAEMVEDQWESDWEPDELDMAEAREGMVAQDGGRERRT